MQNRSMAVLLIAPPLFITPLFIPCDNEGRETGSSRKMSKLKYMGMFEGKNIMQERESSRNGGMSEDWN